jgi:hypothetical protein
MSTDPSPIKFVDTAPCKTMRADKNAIETAKTGKVTAEGTIMSIYCRKNAICRALILTTRSLLAIKWKVPRIMRKNPLGRSFSAK